MIIEQVTSHPEVSHVCFYGGWRPFDPAVCVYTDKSTVTSIS